MKKVFSTIVLAALATAFVSCGQSAEEKAKMEEQAKHTADSIAAALSTSIEGAMNDATTAVDSAATGAVETATTAAVEAAEAATKH